MKCMIWKDTDFAKERIAHTADQIFANEQLIHLLEPSAILRLHQTIDRLSDLDDIDSMMLTRLRFACNLHFDLPVELRLSVKREAGKLRDEVKSLAELLEMLPEDEAGSAVGDVRIVINDLVKDAQTVEEEQKTKAIVKNMIAELFQQFVFLNLNMDVMSKSEIQKTIVKERFRKEYPKLRNNLSRALDAMEAVIDVERLSTEGRKTADDMKATLQEIKTEMAKASKRPIRIAAMGTKKAGKSVIINTLLKQEYAPTSSELPTPNIIQYMPEASDSKLWMTYKGQDREFESSEELRAYIEKEFKEAQQHTGDGAGLEDMVIHYPTQELTGFEIYDTPGPNFAGAGDAHEKIAENCIERADVCIFVMNYSTHLTSDEVNFLQKIHKFFKEKGKFYSLLIAVNRIDERYSAEVEKSVTRVVDYIRKRLDGLEYPNIVTFGTSALQSFYLEKVRQICAREGENGNLVITRDGIKSLKKDHRKWMTQLSFIGTSLENLEDFHGFEDPTDSDLERMSGIPQLRRYVRYIGEQKADLEIVDHIIGVCEMKAKTVKNALEVTRFQELVKHDRKKICRLKEAVRKLKTGIEKVLKWGLEYAISERDKSAARDWLGENRQENEEQACKRIADGIEARIDCMPFSKKEMDALYHGNGLSEIESLQEATRDSIRAINQETGRKVQNGMAAYCEKLALRFGSTMEAIQEKIKDEVKRIDQELEEEKDVQAMFRSFELPQFPVGVEFPTVEIEGIHAVFDPSQLRSHAQAVREDYMVERSADGIWENICSFFGKKYYREEHKYDDEDFKRRLQESAIEVAQDAMRVVFDKALQNQEKQMSDYIEQLHDQRIAYEGNYDAIFEQYMNMVQLLLDDTEAHKEAVQQDIATFTEMNRVTQPFFTLFGDIVAPPAKEA